MVSLLFHSSYPTAQLNTSSTQAEYYRLNELDKELPVAPHIPFDYVVAYSGEVSTNSHNK